jgi:hypothetical protein
MYNVQRTTIFPKTDPQFVPFQRAQESIPASYVAQQSMGARNRVGIGLSYQPSQSPNL